jgi:hypothetical protein
MDLLSALKEIGTNVGLVVDDELNDITEIIGIMAENIANEFMNEDEK